MKEKLMNLDIKYKIAILAGMLITIIIIFMVVYNYYYASNENEYIINEETIKDNITEENNNIEENNTKDSKTNSKIGINKPEKAIIVHVIGEVQNPGVVTLEEGARIIDAIEAAGGKTEEADLSKINLAYVIEDGVQIYIPRIGEKEEKNISEEAGEDIIIESSKQDEVNTKSIKVDINNASLEKLQTLPGVGLSTAQKIIDYRKEHGKFKEISELKNIKGIGESKFNSLKEHIIIK